MSSSLFRARLPQLVTAGILALLFLAAGQLYDGFVSAPVVANFFTDNAALGIAAVGMTLVIFSGGIDLSVGAVAGFSSILVAVLVEQHGLPPGLAFALALLIGSALGAGMGVIIHVFQQPAFLVTLAGMFLMRGCAYWLTTESVGISGTWYSTLSSFELTLGGRITLGLPALLVGFFLLVGVVLAHYMRVGRTLLALGGNEQSALLMGLPVGPARIFVYAFNGFCAAAAGLVLLLYTGSGNPSFGLGMELDAIAVVVIGGTLLSGGRGHMVGTLLGLLVFAVIQSALIFDGRLNPAWARIIVGALLLLFILLQRALLHRIEAR